MGGGELSGYFFGLSISTILGAALTVVLTFFILSLPLRLLIVYSNNYKIAIRCRKIADWLLFFILLFVIIQSLSASIMASLVFLNEKDVFWGMLSRTTASLMSIMPFYIIVSRIVNRVEFYSEKHTSYLDYFILYLRSFKDDKKGKSERRLMHALKRLYFPFAIGRPNEFMPQRGAKRIYLGDNWQEVVVGLQKKAPLILQRVNTSENFLWEFDQCVQGGHLSKVLFWVADYEEYDQFRALIADKYDLRFPAMNKDMKCEQVFYYLPDGTFRVYALTDKRAYHDLGDQYLKDHPQHVEENGSYFYGRRWWEMLTLALTPVYSKRVTEGVNRWSWIGFLFPDFYVICQPIKWRILWYSLFILLPLFAVNGFISWSIPLIYPLVYMWAMGKNGRTMIWLSKKWESVAYFNKEVSKRNFLVVLLGVFRIAIGVGIVAILLFNPLGWDIPHYPFAFW